MEQRKKAMNIKYQNAKDALAMAYASSLVGMANTMKGMLLNAKWENEVINDDVACEWVLGHLRAITDASNYKDGLYPLSLRPEVFMHIVALYQMVYRIEHRNMPMSYPPLTITAQVLANIAVNNSYYDRSPDAIGLVPHEEMEQIDNAITPAFSGNVDGEWIYINWYDDAMKECLEAVKIYEGIEELKRDSERMNEKMRTQNA